MQSNDCCDSSKVNQAHTRTGDQVIISSGAGVVTFLIFLAAWGLGASDPRKRGLKPTTSRSACYCGDNRIPVQISVKKCVLQTWVGLEHDTMIDPAGADTPPPCMYPPEPHNLSPAAAASTPRIIIVIIISFCR